MPAKSPLFFERFSMQVEGTSRSYTKVKIVVWTGEADRFCKTRVIVSWFVLDDGSFGTPKVEIEDDLFKMPHAIRIMERLLRAMERTRYDATPSEVQAALLRLRATKCVHDERFNTSAVASDQHAPV